MKGARAAEAAQRCGDAERDALPVARDGERRLPDARGKVSGHAKRERHARKHGFQLPMPSRSAGTWRRSSARCAGSPRGGRV